MLVMALLQRAGKRARRKTKLLTNAGTTAEGVQDEVVGSLAQGLVDGCHVFPSWSLDESASHRRRPRAWRECWSSALHPPSYTVEADGSKKLLQNPVSLRTVKSRKRGPKEYS